MKGKNMNYYIGESGSTGRYFDEFDDFVSALRDLADTYETEGNETFEMEVIQDWKRGIIMFKRSCEDTTRIYICLFGRRFIFEEGKYVGWYHPNLNKVV